MMVPASIVTGIGGLLYWQNATGRWESWSYAWALIVASVGVSIGFVKSELFAVVTLIVLVTTLVNTVNNDEVGPVIRFALDNPKKIGFISFQPVSFTGRDEDITPERRAAQRYTLSHLAHDVARQSGVTDPLTDWFPLSGLGPFADLVDLMHGFAERFRNETNIALDVLVGTVHSGVAMAMAMAVPIAQMMSR